MLEQDFILKPSLTYNLLIAGALMVSVWVALTLPFYVMIMLGLYGVYLFWRFGFLQGQDAIIALKHGDDGMWQVKTRKQIYLARLCGDSVVTAQVMVLRFRVAKQFFTPACVLFRDSLPPDQFRKLILSCRFQ